MDLLRENWELRTLKVKRDLEKLISGRTASDVS